MRRELAEWAEEVHQLSQRRAAGLILVVQATLRYEHHRDPQEALRVRLRELACWVQSIPPLRTTLCRHPVQ